jgi:cobyrinic acid a,c-diamide synthase
MAGVFALDLNMHGRPVGHGYTECRVDRDNPFFAQGTVLRGHEFHYSGPITELPDDHGCMTMLSGIGLGNHRDGLVYKNCLAGYTHLHASGVPAWAAAVVARAAGYRAKMGRAGLVGEADDRAMRIDRSVDNSAKAVCDPDVRVQPRLSGC